MRTLLLTGLIFFFGVKLFYGQELSSETGLVIENHQEVKLVVEGLSHDALDMGLTEKRIESRVNLRLRQVGLRPIDKANAFLYIDIMVASNIVNLSLSFIRTTIYYVGDELYQTPAIVYHISRTGRHAQDTEFIISGLDALLDEFLSDYLDAND